MAPLLALIGLATLLIPASAHAYSIDTWSINVLCGVLPCTTAGGGAQGLSFYVLDRVVTALEVGIVAAAIIMLFINAIRMAVLSTQETAVSEARTSYIHIITGLAIIGLSRWFVMAFSPTINGAALVNGGVVEQGVGNIVTYFKLILAISLLVNIAVQAFRLITSQGEQDQVDKAKNRFIAGFIGAGIVMLANILVISVLPGYGGSTALALQIAGIANYLLTILGFLAVLAIVIAGVLLMLSVDESLKDKAKNMVKTAIVALIVVLVAYAFVTAFILL